MYGENGLANHAAACAYGFLLSMAPMLLLVAFLIFFAFGSSPRAIIALIGTIPFLGNFFDEKWLSSEFFIFSRPSIPGLISVFFIIWAGRILAMAIQRGLKIVFPESKIRSPVKNAVITLVIEVSVIIFVFAVIISSRTAMRFYSLYDFSYRISIIHFFTTHFGGQVAYITLLGIASYCIYCFLPANPPRKLSAFQGAIFCALAYSCAVIILAFILNRTRYNFLYGTFGNLIIILINVYFFFSFFFIGAQLAFVTDFYEAVLFSRLRRYKLKAAEKKKGSGFFENLRYSVLVYRIFHPSGSRLKKYFYNYKKGEIVFSHENKKEIVEKIFYLLEGSAEITVSSLDGSESYNSVINSDSFFGGMGYLISGEQTATVRAISNVSVIAIPPALFSLILKYDNNLDRTLIEHMSRSFGMNKHIE
jgi:membrane protein